MKTIKDLNEIKEILNAIRDSRYPNIPMVLLSNIIETGGKFLEDQGQAKKIIRSLVEECLREE